VPPGDNVERRRMDPRCTGLLILFYQSDSCSMSPCLPPTFCLDSAPAPATTFQEGRYPVMPHARSRPESLKTGLGEHGNKLDGTTRRKKSMPACYSFSLVRKVRMSYTRKQ